MPKKKMGVGAKDDLGGLVKDGLSFTKAVYMGSPPRVLHAIHVCDVSYREVCVCNWLGR
jgi:hypothetical protein